MASNPIKYCPRGHGILLRDYDGDICINCGYTEDVEQKIQSTDHSGLELKIMILRVLKAKDRPMSPNTISSLIKEGRSLVEQLLYSMEDENYVRGIGDNGTGGYNMFELNTPREKWFKENKVSE